MIFTKKFQFVLSLFIFLSCCCTPRVYVAISSDDFQFLGLKLYEPPPRSLVLVKNVGKNDNVSIFKGESLFVKSDSMRVVSLKQADSDVVFSVQYSAYNLTRKERDILCEKISNSLFNGVKEKMTKEQRPNILVHLLSSQGRVMHIATNRKMEDQDGYFVNAELYDSVIVDDFSQLK